MVEGNILALKDILNPHEWEGNEGTRLARLSYNLRMTEVKIGPEIKPKVW